MIQFLTPFQNLQHLLETSKAPKRRIEISFEVRKRRQRKELKVLKKTQVTKFKILCIRKDTGIGTSLYSKVLNSHPKEAYKI